MMKSVFRLALFLSVALLALSLCSCGMGSGDGGGEYYAGTAGGASSDSSDGSANATETVALPSGMITAGAWNDNEQYTVWRSLFSQGTGEGGADGKFYEYTVGDASWGFHSLKRVKVTVKRDGEAVAGASVVARAADGAPLFSAVTDACGVAYLFPTADAGTVLASSGGATAEATFGTEERDLTLALSAADEKRNVIEIMFVVDVTGSMGDEIRFLKAELADVIARIAENDESALIKLALLFYRDTDDRVPFEYYDFVDVTADTGMAAQQAALSSQSADGGGDYPEAVDEALALAVGKQWSTGATTKLIFHVLDAPAHEETPHRQKLESAVRTAAEKGIRICPVLCSGAAELTEYTMREAAIYTGGTFIFVTNDSGIGGDHHDPGLPNATVELLNSMLVRLVKGYHTGEFDPPVYWQEDPALHRE